MSDEITVTPEMIEAGIKALKECESPYQDDLVKAVFTAMEAAWRKQIEDQQKHAAWAVANIEETVLEDFDPSLYAEDVK